MPRIPRGETAGGIYHIINRGNTKMQVFDGMEDYEYFLELWEPLKLVDSQPQSCFLLAYEQKKKEIIKSAKT